MLRLTSEQLEWVLHQERQRLARAMGATVSQQWPALAQKLGERTEAFVEAALVQAHRHGLTQHRHAARLVNLWCLWGPAFEDKPGFEWAAAILADARRTPAVKAQQLVLQSRDLLAQQGAAVKPETLDQTDLAITVAAQQPQANSWIEQPQDTAEPRVACDLTALDLGLGDQSWRQEYRLSLVNGMPVATRVPLVVDAQRFRVDKPVPPGTPVEARQVAVLALPQSAGPKATLLLRCSVDHVCHEHIHPRVEIKSPQGGRVLQGQLARLVKWPVYRPEDPPPASTLVPKPPGGVPALKPGAPVSTLVPGGGLARQRVPGHVALSVSTCGLRRAGAPLGEQQAMVSVYPAEQWLLEIRALPQPQWQWPAQGDRPSGSGAQVQLSCDGQPLPAAAWVDGWRLLGPALVAGVDGWWQAMQRAETLLKPRIDFTPGMMHGTTLWTWGAREAVTPEGSLAFWRAQAEGRLMACNADLSIAGDLAFEGALARLRLHAKGEAPLVTQLLHEVADPPMAGELGKLKATWRFAFEAEMDTLSQSSLQTLSLRPEASKLGGLTGEAGLRPRPDGQGFQWYCILKLEPCVVAFQVWDPMLGLQQRTRELWPATPLLEWSVG